MTDRAPHRSPEFIKFWLGQSVSLVGSEVSQPSLIVADTLSVLGTLCIPFVSGAPQQVVLLLSGVSLTIGFAMPMVFVGGGTLRQAVSPPEPIGRVSASTTFVLVSVVPLGALLGGALGEAIGPRGALLVAGVGILLTPLWLLFSPVRSLRTVVEGRD